MNRKTIRLIRQCIGHEVFHHVAQETSAYELWIKLKEMYQAKTSRNKALLMRRLVNLKFQRETTVAEHMSEFQNLPESWETLVVSLNNSAPNRKLTTSMVMDAMFNERGSEERDGFDRSDIGRWKVRLGIGFGSVYHLCRDREWKNSESFQGKQGDVVGEEDWRAIPIGGECPDRGSYCPTWIQCEGRGDAEASLFRSRFDQWRYSLQLCTQKRRDGATTTHKVTYFAVHPNGGVQGTSSYGGAGSEAVRKDNLKTSDYPSASLAE
ncbi:hypothetical protein Acr_24g0008580 [Actinidia rufa]|uniref:Uncharacterized protein n=1 Tax=Actinidia rufa TaxID=165716 RepID=A0A7J0GV64_9ERIC|nr:hypothetical protein Acr_24g0008580 [Actinidia rufa]